MNSAVRPLTLPAAATARCAQPLRQRSIEAVARATCRMFLGNEAVTLQLDDGGGPRRWAGLAALRQEYDARRAALARQGASDWLWNLDYEMGLRAVEALGGAVCQLFGVHADDFARRAAVMECVAALSDDALTRRDESGVLAHACSIDGATAPRAMSRSLTLSRVSSGRVTLQKDTRWDGAGLAGPASATAMPTAPVQPIQTSSVRATLKVAVLKRGWLAADGHPAAARRARLRCKIEPVQLHGPHDSAKDTVADARWQSRLLLLIGIVRNLFRRLTAGDGTLRVELRMLVTSRPRDCLPPIAMRVGKDWNTRMSSQPLCHGVSHGYDDMRRIDGQLRRQRYRLDGGRHESPLAADDGVRLY